MTFHIGSQTGGIINNVAGDQRVTGGQYGTVVTTEAALRAVHELREALRAAALDARTATEARARVEEIDTELRTPQPDRSRVAGRLERLTRLLAAAGTLATAGVALVGPLQTLAGWLGTLGEPILRLLPTLA
jgi:CO/xanthine dehydrogenase Mo-binding subunit